MPWMETCPMKERMRFVVAHETGLYTMTELCERFRVSRKTGYKWVCRSDEEGPAGLKDRSRRPCHSPNETTNEIRTLLINVRRKHPRWGPEKLLDVVGRTHPELKLPARSTVAAILKREGLVTERRRRRRHTHPGRPRTSVTVPNELWTADFKGEFKTLDGVWCFPLTVADEFSRFILGIDGLLETKGKGVRAVFERLFREHGLPCGIRTDNGRPFVAPNAIHGLSALSVWWVKLGIQPERIQPGRPDQNGRHERMHRTMKDETQYPPAGNHPAQQACYDVFRHEFNYERPHQALGQKRPSEVWNPSPRPFPERIPDPQYPKHFLRRRVHKTGNIKFQNQYLFLSLALAREEIGLEEIEHGIWSVYFYNILLGRFDERKFELVT
ncbi:MAG TPA: IS481 family transposase [Chondromyces sp.]|nr:IS481 family transposase [Chondromyces sp.]